VKPRYLWFKISIAFGVLLGLVLLVQSVVTYRYVADSMVRQEAAREADRRFQSIGRAARLTGTRESAALTPVLHELVHENPQQIAWIRIVGLDGKVVAESEQVEGAPVYKSGELGNAMADRQRRPKVRDTPKDGRVLVSLYPMRFGPPSFSRPPGDPSALIAQQPPPVPEPADATPPPDSPRGPRPGRGPRAAPEFVEVAIYLNGYSSHFGGLQENLIVNVSAAVALLVAVVFIGLRFRNYVHGKRIEEELALARRVQTDMFPEEDSLAGHLSFAAKCVPTWQVGGDLYDVFETDDGEVALVLGDVSGKGLPAALLMGVVQGAVRASSGTGSALSHEQAAERLNHLLCMKTARERFVSLFWCYYDRRTGILRYINAGHLPPLLVRREGAVSRVIRLDEGGPVLGLLPGARYTQAEVAVSPGDLLVVYSDGIPEAANARDEEFGENGVLASIDRNWNKPPCDICAAILADVRAFLGKELPQDDQTLLVVRLEAVGKDSERARSATAEAKVAG